MVNLQGLSTTQDFHSIVVKNIPLIDVRAPIEFGAGAFPGAINLPVLDDEDRHQVGICYKQHGREAAFDLAYKRVSGTIKEKRISAWQEFLQKNSNAVLYCFRGGMRSKTAQQWLADHADIQIQRLNGGYKALRRYLIESLKPENLSGIPVILGGRTGVGKTQLLLQLANSIDLEMLANHRGSTFGRYISPQPSQIDFENRLAYALLQHKEKGYQYIILEDEGSYIGARYIPHELARFFKRDTLVLLESDLDQRIELTYKEYVIDAQQQYIEEYGNETGLAQWLEYMESRLFRIRKRLGGLRLKKVQDFLAEGYRSQLVNGDPFLHKEWIRLLLSEYYDPMYDYQIEKSGRKIAFKGGFAQVLEYLKSLEKKTP